MDIESVVTNILEGLALSQYESYRFSAEHSQNVEEGLFPIPYAEIQDVKLNLNFAYVNEEQAQYIRSTEISRLYREIAPKANSLITEIQSQLFSKLSEKNDLDNSILEALKNGVLSEVILSRSKSIFRNHLKKINSNKLDEFDISIPKIIIQAAFQCFQEHFEVSQLLKHIPDIELFKNRLIQQYNATIPLETARPPYEGMPITVDATVLSQLPTDAVQNMSITVNMRNVLKKTIQN